MAGLNSSALQSAIFTTLTGDVGLMAQVDAVYDAPPESATLPYIAFGDGTVADASTKSDAATQHKFAIDVWADGSGRMQLKAIMETVHALLHDAALTLSAGQLALIRFEEAEDKRDESDTPTIRHNGILHFDAVVRE